MMTDCSRLAGRPQKRAHLSGPKRSPPLGPHASPRTGPQPGRVSVMFAAPSLGPEDGPSFGPGLLWVTRNRGHYAAPDLAPRMDTLCDSSVPAFGVRKRVVLWYRNAGSFPNLPDQPRTVSHHLARASLCLFCVPKTGSQNIAQRCHTAGCYAGCDFVGAILSVSQ